MSETPVNDNRLTVLDHSRLRAKAAKPGAERGHISVRDVDIVFETTTGPHAAVKNANLTVRPGEFICLLGPSGCGKSTLMNSIAGFVPPTSGEVTIDGALVTEPGPDRGMVFQQHSLFPWKTVKENVAFGPLMAGVGQNEANSVARTFLSLVGLAAFENAYPNTLSGGMQQRVGIARALANYPSVLLMDEPFGALDAQTRVMMQENLLEIWSEFRNTVVFVTHDIDEAVFLSDRIVVMSASPGRIIADIDVKLPRPREQSLLTSPEFMALKRQCLDLIRQETLNTFQQQNKAG
ncbi:NitT/TauT family transport system ATP-binding protein [Marinobacter nauticus]|jgi:NitT/TauT family transport system ATP-binding protein|uniref:NitT/TauT family transport system ATP-binding protein n=1 Tax=Marinobacter nauticus TaxID=2743 RepID=A0A368XMD0_MARNT|nr:MULTISPECIES: ABC transporter ATP-binding protein [Marinobacter]MCS5563952.1 ABC transporter ATP-binding protein [Oleiphilaceae bacterium]MEC9038098.1 ABC transporter ATP-binding protein [Pseudomonadota bacterium]ERS00500.1 sulfonate ABC transporter ATP-binding lipoprotein [Marinobacter sp. EN3]KAE8545650.1 Organosulfonate ABC transporter ATP-binding protein [Marinobacter nauticus]MEC9386832.1 ABC transporter ATP-binding protein [Pseudomonadota bacterium]|tara:strand:+ start:2771 stop:3649 length:879 start_codon:yes stop_codon:yes gene_type:complete